tara:strand:+ start:3868 stop:5004 length:1137 start_codon:yes stop_codon:yes gene_type:complete
MTQRDYFANGAIVNLKKILLDCEPKNIFLVTGKKSYENSGAKESIEILLKDVGVVRFSDFETNPQFSDIQRGVDYFREGNYDLVIAVGGGSVIDVAKSINILSANPKDLFSYIEKKEKIRIRGKPLIAIPTTSGSGSEATHFSVVYRDKIKYSLADPIILPDYAIVDPDLTMSMSKDLTASTGMDALSQAIESFWNINSTEESKEYSKKAIEFIMSNLEKAVNDPSEKSREAMAKASNLAGKAINITQTTASHAVSYPITSYFNIPHGHAAGLTIPQMMVYNSEVTLKDLLDKRGVEYIKKIMKELTNLIGTENVEQASEKISNLMINIGLETKLSKLGIDDEGIKIIIQNGFNPDRVKNNPRRLTEESLREMLKKIR